MADTKREVAKKAPKKESYKLIVDGVSIGGEVRKKGSKVSLTEIGKTYFQSLKYID